jgi:two-component system sensor histidine kinase ChiS
MRSLGCGPLTQSFLSKYQLWRLSALIFVLALPYCASVSAAPPKNLSFSHVLPDEVEGLGYLLSINQDEQGFIWFGAANGLARYDGYSLRIFRSDPEDPKSLSHSNVHNILRDSQGRMWLGTRDGLNLFDPVNSNFTVFRFDGDDVLKRGANDITSIFEDVNGRGMWLATQAGFYWFNPEDSSYREYDFTEFVAPLPQGVTHNNAVWKVVQDAQGFVWLGTNKHGVLRFDQTRQEFLQYSHNPSDDFSISDNDVRELYLDSKNALWVGTYGGGLNLYDRVQDQFIRYQHVTADKSNIVWDVLEDSEGNIWIGDGSAAHILDPRTGEFSRFTHSVSDESSPGNYVVNTLFEDSAGDMWLGYFPSGVDVVDQQASVFHNYYHNASNPNSVADGGVLTGLEDELGNLWVGAGYGLSYFEPSTETFTRVVHDPDDPGSISGNTILSLLLDSRGALWVGAFADGLNRRAQGESAFTHYKQDEQDPNSILGDEPWSLIEARDGSIWIATEEGVNRYFPDRDEFERYLPEPELIDGDASLYTRVVYEDASGQIWAGSTRGLFLIDPKSKAFTRYAHREDEPSSISADFVSSLFEDSQQRFWVGTNGGGVNLMDRDSGSFKRLDLDDGMPDLVVTGIIEDDSGLIWFSTQRGLARLDVDTWQIRQFDESNGLPGNLYNRDTPFKTRDGKLFFGSSKGFTIFDPQALKNNNFVPPVHITDFKIFNQSVIPGVEGSPLQVDIGYTDEITLESQQSVFSFEFSALNYYSVESNEYAYFLDGFEKGWNYVGQKRSATYTNLDPGVYTFRVKGSNNEGLWNELGTSIKIRVLPPPWATWWAYLSYLLATIFALLWFAKVQREKVKNERQRADSERDLSERLQQIDKLKDEFLANTSHELRTPLNGIIGLAESLLAGVAGSLSEAAKQNLRMIASSGKRLSSLVEDLLDFSQLQNKSVELNKKSVDLHVLVDIVIGLTWPILGSKSIDLINAIEPSTPVIEADEDRVLQILHNLIGNAIKFTEEGEVIVDAQASETEVVVRIRDSGIGISEENLDLIFESFKQVDSASDRRFGGTGLGLTISKSLVELHGGRIWAERNASVGSTFCFSLPLGDAAESAEQEASSILSAMRSTQPTQESAQTEHLEREPDKPDVYNILVVDDEPINRKVLGNYLSLKNYHVIEAESGQQALQIMRDSKRIDMLLLDVMMPVMSGHEVCKTLRGEFPQHELPIIFLTARSQVSDLVMGFEAGGNDFIAKPVAKEELLARVNTHLQLLDISRTLDRKVAERTQELAEKSQHLMQTQQVLEDANRKLNQASLTDSLTGLRNRRFVNINIGNDLSHIDRVHNDWNKSHSRGHPPESDLIFMLLDVDHFKKVNDNFGHRAGDLVLQQLSEIVMNTLRDTDYFVRWGGEEFLIVMRYSERRQAPEMAQRILDSIREHLFDLGDGNHVQKTCSIGFAAYPFYSGAPDYVSWEQVIDVADRALYIAKKSGRDCWIGVDAPRLYQAGDWPEGGAERLESMLEHFELRIKSSLSEKRVEI